jgi:hypothetical protein
LQTKKDFDIRDIDGDGNVTAAEQAEFNFKNRR